MISLILSLDIYTYNYLLDLEAKFKSNFFLKNLDLARMLLLSLGEIGRGILKILAYLPLNKLLLIIFFVSFILN